MGHRGTGWTDDSGTRHLRWSVPTADQTVQDWIDAQSDVEASLRAAIREVVAAHGITDLPNQPVQQQLRRGRPRGSRTRTRTPRTTTAPAPKPASKQRPAATTPASGQALRRSAAPAPVPAAITGEDDRVDMNALMMAATRR